MFSLEFLFKQNQIDLVWYNSLLFCDNPNVLRTIGMIIKQTVGRGLAVYKGDR